MLVKYTEFQVMIYVLTYNLSGVQRIHEQATKQRKLCYLRNAINILCMDFAYLHELSL